MLTLSLRIFSAVVAYRPDQELLLEVVSVLARTTECVLIFANSPLSQVHREGLLAVGGNARIEIIQSRENVGLGSAYNEIMATAIKRQHEPLRVVGDLLSAEIAEKQARSIKYQLTVAKLPLAKDINDSESLRTSSPGKRRRPSNIPVSGH